MFAFVLKRLLSAIPTLFVIITALLLAGLQAPRPHG